MSRSAENLLMARLASTTVLDAAYAWYAMQEQGPAAITAGEWAALRPRLEELLVSGEYGFSVQTRVSQQGLVRDLWSDQDRIVLKGLTLVLEPVLQDHVSPRCLNLHGRDGARAALTEARDYLAANPEGWLLQGRVSGWQERLDHQYLYARLAALIPGEKYILRLLWQFLNRMVYDGTSHRDVEQGIAVDSPLTPLIAALSLTPLDELMEQAGGLYVRILDHWLLALPTRWQLQQVREEADTCLAAMGLPPQESAISRSGRISELPTFLLLEKDDFYSLENTLAGEGAKECSGNQDVSSFPMAPCTPRWSQWARAGVGVLAGVSALGGLDAGGAWAACEEVSGGGLGSFNLDGDASNDMTIVLAGGQCVGTAFCGTLYPNQGSCDAVPYCNWSPAGYKVQFLNGAARTAAFSTAGNQTFGAVEPALTGEISVPNSSTYFLRIKTSNSYYGWLTINSNNQYHFSGFSPRATTATPSSTCTDSDGDLTAAVGVTEPVSLPSTANSSGLAVDVFDFTLRDGGGGDTLPLAVSQIVLHTSGTADPSKVTWRLNGPDAANAIGSYGGGTITFPGLSISVAEGASETYTVNAYYNINTGLTEDQTYVLSIDGDTDLTVDAAKTQMGTTSAVANGSGSTVDITATKLAFTQQPAGSVSGFALSTQPKVTAQDAAGNTDTDFTGTVTLTEASAGSLSNSSQAAVSGVVTFSGLTYIATADQQAFTLTADEPGLLTTADANSVTSDVVATKLAFTTQPAPLTAISATPLDFTTDPVVEARDGNDIRDTGYTTAVTLTETGTGTATYTNNSVAAASGVATFAGLTVTYTNSGGSNESFTLQAGSGGLTTADSSAITSTTPPSVSSIVRLSPTAATTSADSVVFRVTFNEEVQNVDATDFSLSGTAAGDGSISGVSSQSTSVYDVTVDGLTSSNGTVNLDVDSGQNITGLESTPLASTTPTGADETYTLDNTPPTISDGFVSISGASGTGGAFKVGDTVTATWNNTGSGDNNSDVASVTVDFSQFGGGAAVSAGNSSGTWTATYTLTEGIIDASSRNVSVTATDSVGNSATTADTSNATVDNQSPGTPTGTLAVDENSANTTAVGTVSGGGADGVSYSMTDSANGRFAISSAGAVTVADGSQLDYESNTSHNITVRATDNAGNTTDAVLSVTVNNVNDVAPTFSNLNGDAVTFGVGGTPVRLDSGGDATLSDTDSTDLNGGNVTVAIVTNGQAGEDILQVGAVGTISTSGADVNHSDGVTIGTFSGGSSGADLVVSLNSNATVARVQDLIRALQYGNSDTVTSNTLARTVRVTTNDGGQTSTNQDVTVSLVRAPLIDLDGDDSSGASDGGFNTSFTEDGGAVAVTDTDTTISDDGTFKALTVTLSNSPDGASESLSSTNGTGAQTVNGEAVTIAAYNSGSGILSITIDDGSTSAATMETLMESIRYNNSSDTPDLTSRTVSFSATDNSDEVGPTVNAVITMSSANDPPVLDNNTGFTVLEGGQHTLANTELHFTDPDNSAAEISYSVSSTPGSGQLEFAAVPGVAITSFTQDDIDTGKVNFVNAGGEATTDSFTVNVSDGAGGSVNGTTVSISITPVDDPPTISGTPATTASHGDNYSFVPTANDAEGDGLSFSINNKPSWATFDTATGALSGIPGSANVGTTTTGIDISVTANGKSDSLAAFDLTVTNSAPVFTGTPTITGTAKVEQILGLTETATTDPDGDSVTLSYQWAADSIDILGAVSAVYTVTEEEKGKTLTCTLTAEDGLGGSSNFTTAGVKVKSFNWMIFYRAFIPGKGYVNIEPQQSSNSSEENNQ